MKQFAYLMTVLALSACGSDGSPSGNGNIRSNYHTRGQVGAFPNEAKESNDNITQVMSRSDAQRADFVKYRLNLNGYENTPTEETDLLAIANAAFDIAAFINGDTTELRPTDNNVLRAALSVIMADMGACADAGNAEAINACISGFSGGTDFASKVNQVYLNTESGLTADELNFHKSDGTDDTLTFTINAAGKITDVTVDGVSYERNKNTFENGTKKLTYSSGMAGATQPLLYSDFGEYVITDTATNTTTRQLFYAGYDDAKKIAIDKIWWPGVNGTIEFKGRAIGTVSNGTNAKTDLNGEARLLFYGATKRSELSANFSNWYDVTVTSDDTISFDNFQGDAAYKFATSGDGVSHAGAEFNVNYYDSKSKPSKIEGGEKFFDPTEAVGGAQYSEGNIEMDMVFGVKKQ